MSERFEGSSPGLVVSKDEPLIGILLEENGHEVTLFFSNEEEATRAVSATSRLEALELAGAWKDLDWDQMAKELDRIRHDSPPSPPISL